MANGGTLVWGEDSEAVHALLAHRGLQRIARLRIDGADPEWLHEGERTVQSFARTKSGFAFVANTHVEHNELYACAPDGGKEQRLGRFNDWTDGHATPRQERRTFRVPDGQGGEEDVQVTGANSPNDCAGIGATWTCRSNWPPWMRCRPRASPATWSPSRANPTVAF